MYSYEIVLFYLSEVLKPIFIVVLAFVIVGFTSKWYIVQSSVEVGQWFILLIITISTLLNIGYFTPIIYKFFFKNELKEVSFKTLPQDINLSIIICCALMVILFLQPNLVMEIISNVK